MRISVGLPSLLAAAVVAAGSLLANGSGLHAAAAAMHQSQPYNREPSFGLTGDSSISSYSPAYRPSTLVKLKSQYDNDDDNDTPFDHQGDELQANSQKRSSSFFDNLVSSIAQQPTSALHEDTDSNRSISSDIIRTALNSNAEALSLSAAATTTATASSSTFINTDRSNESSQVYSQPSNMMLSNYSLVSEIVANKSDNLTGNYTEFATVNYGDGLIGVNATDPYNIITESRSFSLPDGIQVSVAAL